MIFDGLHYAGCLAHLGRPMLVGSLPFAVLRRPIPGTPHHDFLSTWPYGSAPDGAGLPAAIEELRATGGVSFTGMITPAAADYDQAAPLAGAVAVRPLKPHYVIDRKHGLPLPSAKTRRNIKIAARAWTIDPAPDRAAVLGAALPLYAALQHRRQMSSEMTRMPPEHFRALLEVPGIVAIAARRGDAIGALVIAARDGGESHLLHFLVDDDAIATCPTYLLMAHISEAWTERGPVYLGGAPSGPDGPGVAKFKSRWASHATPAWLLTAILRDDLYRRLTGPEAETSDYFPAYRQPEPTALPALAGVD